MNIEQNILSDIIVWMKYSKFVPAKNRRETWSELVDRNKKMHLDKFPSLENEINEAYKNVYEKKVLPSMRSMQFAGRPIELNNSRIFNCAYLPIDDYRAFSEIMFLLLSGCGVGYSVQQHHIEKLPEIRKPLKVKRYLIGDSIEGWADAVKMLCKAYFGLSNYLPLFDFRDIRAKGARLVTAGGKAPGPEPLKIALTYVQAIFDRKQDGERLTSLECHDMICHLADAVLSGGIRRAALISLFSWGDEEMLTCKFGNWWELNPQRGRANNSALLLRNKIDRDTFFDLWKKIELSNSGEPGFLFSNDKDAGTNPCAEINLRACQFCNLTTINASNLDSQEDLNLRARAAAIIGTLQASYTDFHYLRDVWKKTTEKEALLGVSMTGIAAGEVFKYNLKEAAKVVVKTNEEWASKIGINAAARATTLKPEGTSSLVLGTSAGAHDWHDYFWLRRIKIGKGEAIYAFLSIYQPELLEDDVLDSKFAYVIVPQKAPEGASIRPNQTALGLLERVKKINREWIKPGHKKGVNMHNVSATITMKSDEWEEVGEWLFENKDYFTALSFLPEDLGSYVQTPYESINAEEFYKRVQHLHELDITQVIEAEDETNLMGELACSGGACEVK
jgi:ribonucleoside-triphosphate reductase